MTGPGNDEKPTRPHVQATLIMLGVVPFLVIEDSVDREDIDTAFGESDGQSAWLESPCAESTTSVLDSERGEVHQL
jgi:hypothetical protein